jgi:hypothetical protein
MADEILFCKDCIWFRKKFWDEESNAKCTHPSALRISVKEKQIDDFDFFVTGEKKPEPKRSLGDYNYCATQRKFDCGREGKFFEPKNEQARRLFKVERKLDKE